MAKLPLYSFNPVNAILVFSKGTESVKVGTATSISVTSSRNKLPVYTLGHVDPVAWGRGRRIIVGAVYDVFMQKDAEELLKLVNRIDKIFKTQPYAQDYGESGDAVNISGVQVGIKVTPNKPDEYHLD